MSSQFDWRTEDERTTETPLFPSRPRSAGRLYRLLVTASLLVALTVAVGWALWSQFQRQVERLAEETREAALGDHRRVEAAAARGDVELFNNWLSGRDPTWVYSQWALIRAGLYQDRQPFGLTVIWDEVEPSVWLSPDMTLAEVTTLRPYQTVNGDGVTERVILEQTAVYRFGVDDKWILVPPEADFWGEREEIRLRHLIVAYPARDREIVTRLADDLERQLAHLCRAAANDTLTLCPADFRVILYLETDPGSLAGLINPARRLTAAQRVSLPTPSLVGLPADEAAYRALYRGYAVQLLSPLAGYLLNWECCFHDLYYAALLDWQLAQWGLKVWPLTGDDYVALLEQAPRIEGLRVNWYTALSDNTSDAEQTAVRAFVEFLLNRYGQEAGWAERQRYLGGTTDFREWVALNQPQPLSLAQIEADWYDYIVERVMAAQGEPPTPMPEAALYLACYQEPRPVRGDDGILARQGELTIWRYDFGAETKSAVWREQFGPQTNVMLNQMRPLPDSSGLQLTATLVNGFQLTGRLWLSQGGATQQLWPHPNVGELTDLRLLGADPTGKRLYLMGGTQGDLQVNLLQADPCRVSGDCATASLPGWPIWSPDGRRMIVIGNAEGYDGLAEPPVYLADGDGQELTRLGAAVIPIWVDNETALFFRREPEPYLDLLDWDNMALRPLFPLADMLALLPEEISWNDSHFLQILPDPANPRRWYIFGSTGYWEIQRDSVHQSYIIVYDTVDGRFELHHYDNARLAYNSGGISSDGRYLSLKVQQTPLVMVGRGHSLQVLDAANGVLLAEFETIYLGQVEGGAIWSPDGRWVSILQDRALLLYAPEYDYRYFFGATPPGCELAAWAD